jgi:hypothetical protein
MWCQRLHNMYYNVYTYTNKQPSKRTKHIMVPCVFIYLVLLMYVFLNLIETRLAQRVPLVELELLIIKDKLSWSHHFDSFTVATIIWLTVMEYLCHKRPRICSTCRKHFQVLSSFMTYHRVCNYINTTGVTTLPKHLSSSTVFSGVRVTRSLVLCVCCVGRCLFFCTFSSGHCVICPSIYGFWLPLWCLQFLLIVLIRLGLEFIKPFKYELCTRISKYIQSGSPTH